MADQPDSLNAATETGKASAGKSKRAVVVIHGMGSQSPMETLRTFVEAVWTSAPWLAEHDKALTWSKRDFASESYETRRITTNYDKSGKRTDFYEFYWAHMMEDTRVSHVTSWLKRLFFRPTSRVPPAVMAPWIAGWVALAILVAIFLVAEFVLRPKIAPNSVGFFYAVLVAIIGAAYAFLRHRVIVEVVGDAARYLTAAPPNIAARSRIRTAGLDVLRALTERGDYDRIIVVCHSLGTVVGYDLLSLYWSEINKKIEHTSESREVLEAIEDAAAELRDSPDDVAKLKTFRDAQKAYFDEVCRVAPGVWKITDFVTLGSPLTHAHFLLVEDGQELLDSETKMIGAAWLKKWWPRLAPVMMKVAELFRARAAQRELPLCPPLPERGNAFTYSPPDGRVMPHHAALFAAVRWTNIFAPRRNLLWGDVVAGPLAPLFGPGVKDVALNGDAGRSFIAHTKYWRQGRKDGEHLEALRAALNLMNEAEAVAWQRHAEEVKKLGEKASA